MPDSAHQAYEKAFEGVTAPFAFVDLDALRANAEAMLAAAGSKPIRVASKSVRCRALLERIAAVSRAGGERGTQGRRESASRGDGGSASPSEDAEAAAGFRGLLTFTLPETLFLAEHGWQDLVLAYPTADAEALSRLALASAANPEAAPAVMVDSVEHLDLIESVLGASAPPIRVCIDLDSSLWMLGGRMRIGVKRSPVHAPEQAAALAREICRRDRVQLAGLMAYEAQIAGVPDRPPGRPLRGTAIRWMKRRSAKEIRERRAAAVAAVSEICELGFVNGGGTGSIASTASEDAVTEVAAGSGFYKPVQFDHYEGSPLRPAAGFALPVVRKPGPAVATALGGGYLASGPGDALRLPQPWLPEGLKLDPEEGAGEVQTPLLGPAAEELKLGSRAYLRHVKAGELCERFNSLYLVEGGAVVDEVPTYRGEGRCFL